MDARGVRFVGKKTWGDFEIDFDRVVGHGGSSTVYEARQISLDRPCVVKVLHSDFGEPAQREEFLARFRNEARVLARLRDPRFVQVYQAGETEGRLWIAMERVQGQTLQKTLESGRLFSEEEACRIVRDLAQALDGAYRSEKIIHRDIKPANVFLLEDGQVRLADFGLAKIARPNETRITQSGTVLGTPAYISPEVIRGEAVDHRSDLYALGCLLYELLVQVPPFEGENYAALFYKHINEAPIPPKDLRPELSDRVNEIILTCLKKNKDERYASYTEFLNAFETPAEPTPAPSRIPWIPILTLGVLFLVAAGVWAARPRREPPTIIEAPPTTKTRAPSAPTSTPPPQDPLDPARRHIAAGEWEKALAATRGVDGPAAAALRRECLLALERFEEARNEGVPASEIARRLVEAGRLEEALKVAQTGACPDLAALVLALTGDLPRALAEIEKLPDSPWRNPIRLAAAASENELQSIEAAERLLAAADGLSQAAAASDTTLAAFAAAHADAALQRLGAPPDAALLEKVNRPVHVAPLPPLDPERVLAEIRNHPPEKRPALLKRARAVAERVGHRDLSAGLDQIEREIRSDELLASGNLVDVLLFHRPGRAYDEAARRLLAAARESRKKNLISHSEADLDAWKVKTPRQDKVIVDPSDAGLRLEGETEAYLKRTDDRMRLGFTLDVEAHPAEGGWMQIVLHEEAGVFVRFAGGKIVLSRGGTTLAESAGEFKGPLTIDVVTHQTLLLVYVDGELRLTAKAQDVLDGAVRVGISNGSLVLRRVLVAE